MDRRRFVRTLPPIVVGGMLQLNPGLFRRQVRRWNVRDLGAIGNGLTDDTTAFERALDRAASEGGRVWVPEGIYPVRHLLKLRTEVTLEGEGPASILQHDSGDPVCLAAVDAQDIAIRDIAIRGRFSFAVLIERSLRAALSGLVVTGGTLRWAPRAFCGGIIAVESNDVTIEGSDFEGNGSIGQGVLSADIQINGFGRNISSANIHLLDNRCRSKATQSCISGYDMRNAEIARNICSGAKTGPGNNNGYGVLIYQTALSPGSCFGNSVHHNIISQTEGSGIYLQQSNRSRVYSNSIFDVASVQKDDLLPVGGIALNKSQLVAIEENSISQSGRAGIVVASNEPNTGHVQIRRNVVSQTLGQPIQYRGPLVDILSEDNTT